MSTQGSGASDGLVVSCVEIFFLTLIGTPTLSALSDVVVPVEGGIVVYWLIESALAVGCCTILLQVLALVAARGSPDRLSLHSSIAEAHLGALVVALATLLVFISVTAWGPMGAGTTRGPGALSAYAVSPWVTWVQASSGEWSWELQQDGLYHAGTEYSGPSVAGSCMMAGSLSFLLVLLLSSCCAALSPGHAKGLLVLDPSTLALSNAFVCGVVAPGVSTGYGLCQYPTGFAVLYVAFAALECAVRYLCNSNQSLQGTEMWLLVLSFTPFHVAPPVLLVCMKVMSLALGGIPDPPAGVWLVVACITALGLLMEFVYWSARQPDGMGASGEIQPSFKPEPQAQPPASQSVLPNGIQAMFERTRMRKDV